jgi:ABC-type antimicrobial peptide transport system permease subunit
MAAVGFLLLIACANVSVLLLSRSTVRKQEISMRIALGASAARILQQLLTESLLLASGGCLLGVFLAWGGVPAVLALLPETSVPHESAISLNLYVLSFTLLISFATGVLSGLAPALASIRSTVYSAVQSGNRASTGRGSKLDTRTLLVVTGFTAVQNRA